jgi:PilZ domain
MQSPQPGSAGPERRKHPRVRADRPATISVAGQAREVRLRDLSSAGLCFFSEEPLREMTLLQVRLNLPDQEPLSAGGAVVRCQRISKHLEHFEVAVFLHDIRESDRRRLQAFVAGQPPAEN